MTLNQINKTTNRVRTRLAQGRVADAVNELKPLVEAAAEWSLNQEMERIESLYRMMLQYMVKGVSDPTRYKLRTQLVSDLYTLTDVVTAALSMPQSTDLYYIRRQTVVQKNGNIGRLLAQYRQQLNKIELLSSVSEETRDNEVIAKLRREAGTIESDLFNVVWTTFPLSADDSRELAQFMADDNVSWVVKSLLVSALFLALNKFYDEKKVMLLVDVYTQEKHPQVQLRALVALLLTLYTYRRRVAYCPALSDALGRVAAVPTASTDLRSVFIALVRSRNSDNIKERFDTELMNDIEKLRPDLLNKMRRGGNAAPLDLTEADANPEWQEWIEKSGIEERLREFNELQMKGGDVYLSTFSHLKSFPFFHTLSNWFLPYYAEQPELHDRLGKVSLLGLLAVNPYMCDSDKYSMMLSLSNMPDDRRRIIANQLESLSASQDDADEFTADVKPRDMAREPIINSYVQDLYRFFRLYSRRREFYGVFDTELNLLEVPFLEPLVNDDVTVAAIAEFYLKNGFNTDAIAYYTYLREHAAEVPVHIYQKMGFAYQHMGSFRLAIEQYERYELVDPDDVWNLRHIAACYRMLHNPERSLEYYKRALDIKGDDVMLCLNVGHSLLRLGRAGEALKYYFRADYLDAKSQRAWAPIAWCSFLEKNYEQSERYFERLLNEGKPTWNAILNYGHLKLVTGRVAEAVDMYRRALDASGDRDSFVEQMRTDAHYLTGRGVDERDLPLIIDAVIESRQNNTSQE